MNPIFTLNYPEFLIAEHLKKLLSKADGYSILIPVSSQQKGYDIALMHRKDSESKVVTFQVKSSKMHSEPIGIGPRNGLQNFSNTMWLNRFIVPSEADFFILVGLYAPDPTNLKNSTDVWYPHILLFTNEEMNQSMNSFRQRNTDRPDSFAFGFNNSKEAFLTRGHALKEHPDYSKYLLAKPERLKLIKDKF